MLRLPIESLGHIFVECLPDDPCLDCLQPNSEVAPLLLMRVCRQWREVALHTTQLWCSLSTIPGGGRGSRLDPICPQRIIGYHDWLSRSGNRPLSLEIGFDAYGEWNDEWLQILGPHRAQFRRLRAVDEIGLDVNKLLENANMLQFFALEVRHQSNWNLAIADTPPSLCMLVLDGVYAGPRTLPGPSWANLTHLAIRLPQEGSCGVDRFMGLVSCCPNLLRLIFGRLSLESPNPLPPPYFHSNLRSLTIALDDDFNLTESHLLRLPALFSLKVQNYLPYILEDELTEDCMVTTLPNERVLKLQVESIAAIRLFDVSWSNITDLVVELGRDMAIFHTALELCSNLEYLYIYSQYGGVASTSLPGPFTHTSLSELHLAVQAPLGNLLQMATLPRLEYLHIAAATCGEHALLYTFLARSGCALQRLTVITGYLETYWTKEESDALTTLMPTLTELYLRPFAT